MKWPAIVRYQDSDELEIIESLKSWNDFLINVAVDCQLILSDGTLHSVTASAVNDASCIATEEVVNVETAIELARKHMAAQEHCCVSKFYAPSVEDVIATLVLLEA